MHPVIINLHAYPTEWKKQKKGGRGQRAPTPQSERNRKKVIEASGRLPHRTQETEKKVVEPSQPLPHRKQETEKRR